MTLSAPWTANRRFRYLRAIHGRFPEPRQVVLTDFRESYEICAGNTEEEFSLDLGLSKSPSNQDPRLRARLLEQRYIREEGRASWRSTLPNILGRSAGSAS